MLERFGTIPNIKKLSWNMKKLPEYEEEYRKSLKCLKDLVTERWVVVIFYEIKSSKKVSKVIGSM